MYLDGVPIQRIPVVANMLEREIYAAERKHACGWHAGERGYARRRSRSGYRYDC
jgi:hypothetical protein